jgi:hypothetical protein
LRSFWPTRRPDFTSRRLKTAQTIAADYRYILKNITTRFLDKPATSF